jgi:hypothetical protein
MFIAIIRDRIGRKLFVSKPADTREEAVNTAWERRPKATQATTETALDGKPSGSDLVTHLREAQPKPKKAATRKPRKARPPRSSRISASPTSRKVRHSTGS